MGGDGTLKNKKHRFVLAVLVLLFAVAVGFVAFRLGRREGDRNGGTEEQAGGRGNEKGNGPEDEKETEFGSGSVSVAPALFDGTFCDFSLGPAPPALVSLADRLIPELERQERVEAAAAYYRRDDAAVYHGMDGLPEGSVLGVGPDFLAAAGFRVEKGRGLSERDVEEKRRVALLDGRAAQVFFPGADPVGETVEVEGRLYQVAGVVDLSEPRTGGGLVLVPESTWGELYQYEEPRSVVLRLLEPPEEALTDEGWEVLRKETGTGAARILNSMVPEGEAIRYQMQ